MTKEKMSMILTTKRGIDSLKPLFVATDKNTELIIVDDDYNDETKIWLAKQKGYERIVYVPIKESSQTHQRTFSQGLNTALLYAENKWIIRADDNLEFKSDFFDVVREDIQTFIENLGNENFVIIGQKVWEELHHQKWEDYSGFSGGRHIQIRNPRFTFSFGIFPINLVYALNGYDERYDCGWGREDVQFLHRLMISGYQAFFDREMFGFSRQHTPKRDTLPITEILYQMDSLEITNGKTRAFNPFDLKELQKQYLVNKDTFII